VYPIFNVFTCRSGGFHVPLSTSMAEDLVLSDAAASAVVGPTGLSDQLHAETLAQAFYHSLAVDRTARLGDVLLDGFAELWLQYPNARELYFYTTFGDPATLIWGGATP
jgi:hypothetical protein